MALLTTRDRTRMSIAAVAAGVATSTIGFVVPDANAAIARRPWSPFYAQESGAAAWLVLGAFVLALGLWTALDARGREGGLRAGGFVIAFTIALATRAALIPFVMVGALVIARHPVRLPAWGHRLPKLVAPLAAALMLTLAVAAVAGRRRVVPAPPLDPAGQVRHWIERDNPWRARHSARIWAGTEARDPGAGHLALAELDRSLGRADRAAQVLARVVAASSSPQLRAEAKRRLDALEARP